VSICCVDERCCLLILHQKNFAAIQDKVIHFTLMEKVQKRNSDRLQLPTTLGQLVRIWVDKYRTILCDKLSEVKSCWVTIRGTPMGKLITKSLVRKKLTSRL